MPGTMIDRANEMIDSYVEQFGYAPAALTLAPDEYAALVNECDHATSSNGLHRPDDSLTFRGIPVRSVGEG